MTGEQSSLRDAPRIGGLALARSGDEVLQRLGLTETSADCCANLAKLLGAQLVAAYVGLRLTRPRYATLKDVAEPED